MAANDDDAPLTARRRRFRRPVGSPTDVADILEHEIGILERALAARGDLQRKELAAAAGAVYWGPGRFGAALRAGLDQGRIRKVGRGYYGV